MTDAARAQVMEQLYARAKPPAGFQWSLAEGAVTGDKGEIYKKYYLALVDHRVRPDDTDQVMRHGTIDVGMYGGDGVIGLARTILDEKPWISNQSPT
jgi:hypothetical protein